VLLSNELLVLALSREGNVKAFEQIVQATGYTQAHYLLILRDPVEQALSLYKHRAKAGTAPDIEVWSADHYHYGSGLKRFLQQATDCSLPLRCRKYSRQLEQLFFGEWLDIPPDQFKKPNKQVNPSLTISELLLIQQLRKQDTLLPKLLYSAFLQLPEQDKAQEPRIKKYYQGILNNALLQYRDTWEACNQYLPDDTPLQLPHPQTPEPDKALTFSARQAEAVSVLMRQLRSPLFLLKLTLIGFRQKLGQLRNRMFNNGKK
jgi:hypothetical protein